MRKQISERDNFTYLIIALVMFLFLGSLAQEALEGPLGVRLVEWALVLALAGGVWSVKKQGLLFRVGLGMAAANLLVSFVGMFVDSGALDAVHVLILLGFFALTAWVAINQVLFSGRIDGNEIVGAICVYLLLGLIWAMVFMLLEKAKPGSLNGLATERGFGHFMELIYFSYVSLSTMGFGDITPASPLSRYFTYMEGILGQFYLAVLVASLVGAAVSQRAQK